MNGAISLHKTPVLMSPGLDVGGRGGAYATFLLKVPILASLGLPYCLARKRSDSTVRG